MSEPKRRHEKRCYSCHRADGSAYPICAETTDGRHWDVRDVAGRHLGVIAKHNGYRRYQAWRKFEGWLVQRPALWAVVMDLCPDGDAS